MNNAQFQNLFDSVCRCFGHTPNVTNGGATASGLGITSSNSLEHGQPQTSKKATDESHSHAGKRRTNRLGLQDEQWDELFEKKKSHSTGSPSKRPPKAGAPAHATAAAVHDLNTAQALAQAKLAANPPRYNRTKRKRPEKAREEIFRSKDVPAVRPTAASSNQTPFSRLLHPSLAMCFATPIRGTEDEPDEARSVDNSDTNTLNTCEDTITSTVYYENKLAHLTETRPPMPLFNQFKIGQQDDIREIMAGDSHSSVNMIRLLQQQKASAASSNRSTADDSHRSKSQRQLRQTTDEEMEDVLPDVKAVSDSSGSDGSVRHAPSRRKVYEA